MNAFGIRFTVRDPERFATLQTLFAAMKLDKESGAFRDTESWKALVPDDVRTKFAWPAATTHNSGRADQIVIIGEPADQLGVTWVFCRVFESVQEGEYALLACELVDATTAEIQIDPFAYPYGGLGPFIALAEAFGFHVVGVNEYGKYQTREELTSQRKRS
jgi:hypothetical protein